MKIPGLQQEGKSIIFTGDYLDIYILKNYFDKGLASYNGNYINSLGFFIFEIKTRSQAEKGERGVQHKLLLPVPIDFQYTSSRKFTGKVTEGSADDEYEVFRLETGNQFLATNSLQKSSKSVYKFIQALHNGYIPNYIPYSDILKLYLDCLAINSVDLKAPSVIYEILIAELCRSKSNLKVPFRKVIGSKDISEHNYTNIRINTLPRLNSSFAGLSFENFSDSAIVALERSATNQEEKESPLEDSSLY